jgi:FK506-binding protein 8
METNIHEIENKNVDEESPSITHETNTTTNDNSLAEQTSQSNHSNSNSRPSTPISPLATSQFEPNVELESKLKEEENSAITKSTVVLTDSQFLDFNNGTESPSNSEKFVEVDKTGETTNEMQNNSQDDLNDLNEEEEADQSLIRSISESQNEENDSKTEVAEEKHEQAVTVDQVEEEENKLSSEFTHLDTNGSETPETNLVGEASNAPDEDYEKDYEITNMDNMKSSITSMSEEVDQKEDNIPAIPVETLPKPPPRNVEKEKFEQILGNKSLLKKITQYGSQDEIQKSRPINGQVVTIFYEAYLCVDEKCEKLVDHNENLEFILGDGDVVSALDIVVSLMDNDEKCEVLTEARHAFGSIGKLPDIPSEATLFYKVHLKDFKDSTDLDKMTPVERLSLAEAKKLRGNFHFNRQDFEWAILSYKKGLKYFKQENLKGDEEEVDKKKFSEMSQALLMNLALSNFKIDECREALNAIDQVLTLHSKHIKALYIKGKILLQLGETQEAIQSLTTSLQLDPTNAEVRKELTKAQAKHKLQYDNEKKLYKKMISGVSAEEQNKKVKSKVRDAKLNGQKSGSESSIVGYIATGMFIAAASVAVAVLARYKNLI